MSETTLPDALRRGPVVLDGGLSTELEARGHDVSTALWSARLLRDDPAAVVAAHAAFAAAGAQVATTASYQATLPGLAAAGVSRAEAERLIASSVALAREGLDQGLEQGLEQGLDEGLDEGLRWGSPAAGRRGWVAGSVGPYGAHLADGSEYTGAYLAPRRGGSSGSSRGGSGCGLSTAELRAFHRPHLQLLAGAGADVLACETLPGAAEVDALLTELDAVGLPAWISLSAVVGADGAVRTRRGELAGPVLAAAASVGCVVAVGVNCTDPAAVLPAVQAVQAVQTAQAGTAGMAAEPALAALVAYPNSGEVWDAAARVWRPGAGAGSGAGEDVDGDVRAWLDAGVALVGGCCRVRPARVRAVAEQVVAWTAGHAATRATAEAAARAPGQA